MDLDSYSQWLQIFDHLNTGALIIDDKRRVRLFNANARKLIGLDSDELMGSDCREIFCGIPCFPRCPFHDPGNTDIRDMDIEFLDEFDAKHRVTRVGAPIYDAERQLCGCVTVLQDHSPYSELVHRIHYEEQSLKIILDSLNLGIFTVNRNGLITFFNRAAEKISGFSRMKLLGRDHRLILGRQSTRDTELLKAAIARKKPVTGIKGLLLTVQGEKIPVTADYVPLLNDQGKIIGGLAALQDLTLVHQLDKAISEKYSFHDMIGKDPAMEKIFEMVRVVAGTESTVLIEGATGTGKDLIAKIIHQAGNRKDKPFVKINCAAIPENLLESEIFGYAKGAFTGADKDKPGRFCEAHTGTIFLDEIGDMPLSLQAKLLRVLEDREFYPLGSRKTRKVDVRILSATNRKLEHLVEQRLFRADLFYRLNVLRIELPTLARRRGDLPLLISHILRKQASRLKHQVPDICEEVMKLLLNHGYPGNIRELENILEHAIIICQGDLILPHHLPEYMVSHTHPGLSAHQSHSTAGRKPPGSERQDIIDLLKRYDGHKGKTAAALQVNRSTLWRKLKKYNIA